jgi:hypothetical protein
MIQISNESFVLEVLLNHCPGKPEGTNADLYKINVKARWRQLKAPLEYQLQLSGPQSGPQSQGIILYKYNFIYICAEYNFPS